MYYQIPEIPTPKRSTLLRFVAAHVYLIKKWTFIKQLLYLAEAKPESAMFHFIKGPCTAEPPCYKCIKF